jgi:integrase
MARTKSRKGRGRRVRGTGTIFWSESRQCYIGRKTVNGRRVEVSAEKQEDVVKKLEAAGPPGPDITLAAWLARWLPGHSGRPGTIDAYSVSFARLVPHVGSVRLQDITPGHVERLAKKLADAGFDPNTVRHTVGRLCMALGAAVRDGVLDRNPVSVVRKPKGAKPDIDPFTPEELAAIIETSAARPGTRVFVLLASTGCRIGEGAGLDVHNWDPETGTVAITRTHRRRKGVDQLGPPKSAGGVRTITVPEPARLALIDAAAGRTAGPLFPSGRGRRPAHQCLLVNWRLLGRMGLRSRNPHQLRHSVATAPISAGDPLGDVAKYLGDTVEVVVSTYLHPTGKDPGLTMNWLLCGTKADDSLDGREVASQPQVRRKRNSA